MAGRWTLALACSVAGLAVSVACGNGASSPDSCRAIEEARCRKAPACNIPLEPPYSTSGTDIDACIRFYDTACLHGLDVPNPGQNAVNQCVAAIVNAPPNSVGCAVVATPQSDPLCAWLIPPAPPATVDATTDATSDAPAEAGSDAAEDTAE
ncbi:MAG: hypothetical protein ACLP1X_02410 [Polyangiaceae bacterium]|jgi:hypothetical protein